MFHYVRCLCKWLFSLVMYVHVRAMREAGSSVEKCATCELCIASSDITDASWVALACRWAGGVVMSSVHAVKRTHTAVLALWVWSLWNPRYVQNYTDKHIGQVGDLALPYNTDRNSGRERRGSWWNREQEGENGINVRHRVKEESVEKDRET